MITTLLLLASGIALLLGGGQALVRGYRSRSATAAGSSGPEGVVLLTLWLLYTLWRLAPAG